MQFLVAGLRTGQQVTLTVKAIYDDGSFLWSNPCSFVVPVRATKAFKDGGLVDIEAAPDGLETDGDVWGAAM